MGNMPEGPDESMSAGERRNKRPPSDSEDVSPHLHAVSSTALDHYRIRQLEDRVTVSEERMDKYDEQMSDMKIWRGYVLGAAATAGVMFGIIMSILGLGWFQWKN